MITRFQLIACVFAACLATAALAEYQRVPFAQIDVFAGNEVGPTLARFAASQAMASAVDSLPADRRAAFAATAAGAAPKGIAIGPVAHNRLRIRVASPDRAASTALAENLRRDLVAAGVKERFSLYFTSSGATGRLLILSATALAGLMLCAEWAMRRRGVRARPLPMRGAASI